MSSMSIKRRSDRRDSHRREDRDRDRQQASYQSQATATYSADTYPASQASTTYPADPYYNSQAATTYPANTYPSSQVAITYPANSGYQSQATAASVWPDYQTQAATTYPADRSVSSSPQPSYHNSGVIPDITYAGPAGSGTRVGPMASTQYASAEAQFGYRGAYRQYVVSSARLPQDRENGDWICPSCRRSVPSTYQCCPHCAAQRPNGQQTSLQTQNQYPQNQYPPAQSYQGEQYSGGRGDASRLACPRCGGQEGMPLISAISPGQAVPLCSRC